MSTDAPKPRFVLTLEPLPSCTDPIRALRAVLKRARRQDHLRCVSAREEQSPNENPEFARERE